MKIQPVTNCNYKDNTKFQGANKFCKYSIRTLIASTTLLMFSNALDTFKSEKVGKEVTSNITLIASALGIVGTALGIFGLEKVENYKTK